MNISATRTGNSLTGVFVGCAVLGGVIVGAIWGAAALLTDDEVRVREPMKPIRIELVVEDNVVDTVFVYKIP